jgi:hypothetical protein
MRGYVDERIEIIKGDAQFIPTIRSMLKSCHIVYQYIWSILVQGCFNFFSKAIEDKEREHDFN